MVDEIHRWVEHRMQANNLRSIDDMLYVINLKDATNDELITWLTATLPVKNRLRNRTVLLSTLKSNTDDPRLWQGL